VSSLDDHIRSVLDRIRVTLSGQLEADLTVSTADILRAVADDHRQAVSNAEERVVSSEARLDAAERLAVARANFDREREVLQQGATAEIEGLERALGELRDELEVARRSLEEAQNTQNELGRELEEVRRTAEDRQHQLESLRARLGQTSQLTSAFRTLDEAATLGDILDRLAHAACQETGRTAVFLLNDDRLRGWRAFGFEAESIVGADFDSQAPDLVGLAARSGAGQHHRDGDDAGLPAFAKAEGPRDAVALPVQVGGSVIAVLYADTASADRPEEPQWVETMNALAKHAGRVLEAMTMNQAAALWRPRPDVRLPPRRRGERSSVGRK
jgi:hypothetical protein